MPSKLHSLQEMCIAGSSSERAVRWWQEKGLLGEVQRTAGQVRRYTDEQMKRAAIIAAAQFGGWSLEDIKAMVEGYDREVYEALMTRLNDQVKMAARLAQNIPEPAVTRPAVVEYDL